MDESIEKLIKKANEGLADAQCQLAFCYLEGDRVEKSDIKAFYFLPKPQNKTIPLLSLNSHAFTGTA